MSANLTLLKKPPEVVLLEEGLNYQIESLRNWGEIPATLRLIFPDTYASYLNKSFVLNISDIVHSFTFRLTPDQSGYEFRTFDAGDSLLVFLFYLSEDFAKNYYLTSLYDIYADATGLTFTARTPGVLSNISLQSSEIPGIVEDSKTLGIDGNMPSDYRVYVAQLLTSSGLNGYPLGQDLIPLDISNIAYTNLQEYLDKYIKSTFHFPFSATNIWQLPDATKSIFIQYAEFFNNQIQILNNDIDSPILVIPGGLNQFDSDFLKKLNSDYYSYLENNKRFLTWSPVDKLTYPGMPERLYFLAQTTGKITINVKAVYPAVVRSVILGTLSPVANSIIEIACGPGEILSVAPLDDMLYYEIYLTIGVTTVSETRTFTLDHSFYQFVRTIIFKNSFGMFDMLHCTGDLKILDSIKTDEINALKDDVFRRQILLKENIQKYVLDTGWLDSQTSNDWLQDLLITNEAYLILDSNLLPIVITNKKSLTYEDRMYLLSRSISFERDFNYSKHSSVVLL